METTYTQRELVHIADKLETYAQDLRDTPDSATLRQIVDYFLVGHHNGYFARLEDRLRGEEYFDCDLCESDFHTETEQGGAECRKLKREFAGRN
jgi:hypothetical protein